MKLTVLASLSALLLFSCDNASEIESVNTLGTDVKVSMTEYFEPGQRTLSFKFLTQKDFPCINYRIASEYRQEGQAIEVSLSEVQGADVCLEAIAPASSFLDLGELTPGEYDITIRVGESLANTGTLTVSDESFDLLMNEEQGLIIETPQVLRIPRDVIWGETAHKSETVEASMSQYFSQRLQQMGAVPHQLPTGDYGYFTIDAAGVVTSSINSSRLFLLEYQGEIEDIAPIMEEASALYGSAASISLRNPRGEELKSWAL